MNFKYLINKLIKKILPSKKTASEPTSSDVYELLDIRYDEDSSPFLNSLKHLDADDIAPKPDKKQRSAQDLIVDILRRAVMVVCVIVFVSSAFNLVKRLIDYNRGDDIYGKISDNIFETNLGGERSVKLEVKSKQSPALPDFFTSLNSDGEPLEVETPKGEYNVKFEQMKSNLSYLKTINPDIWGYIHIEGTNISYPIVKGADNDYYLDHAYTGEYMVVGSIFADYRTKPELMKNRNTVIYGHNVKAGSMFNNVTRFLEEDIFYNSLIEVYTFDGIYTFEPFAIYQAQETYPFFKTAFLNDQEFVDFCYEMQSNTELDNTMEFTPEDRIVTLSTCYNDLRTIWRWVLQAKLVKIEN